MTSLPAGLLTELFLARIPAAEQQETIRDIIQKLQPPPGKSLDIVATRVAVELLRASPDVSFFRSIPFHYIYSCEKGVGKYSGIMVDQGVSVDSKYSSHERSV